MPNSTSSFPIIGYNCNIINMPFFEKETELYITIEYKIPWYENKNYEYSETCGPINVDTPTLNMENNSEVSTNERIKLINPKQNKEIKISGDVKTVVMDNITGNNLILNIDVQHDITILLRNVNLTTNFNSIIYSASNINIYYEGNNLIQGKLITGNYLIDTKKVSFLGKGNLEIKGHDGNNGPNGTIYSINGSNGEIGTNALRCTDCSIKSGSLIIKGGNGGNGGNGFSQTDANGANGGYGGNGGNAGIAIYLNFIPTNGTFINGFAGLGGNGGNGANGANGSNATTHGVDNPMGSSWAAVPSTAGGAGGNGGNAGRNGNGTIQESTQNFPKGGSGGNGGLGGNGLGSKEKQIYINVSGGLPTIIKTYSMQNPSIGGNGGNGGNGYYGGNGGNGGKGGKGYDGESGGSKSTCYGGAGAFGGAGGQAGTGTISNGSTGNIGAKGANGASYEPSCIAEGTLITLADGRQVPVEKLTGNEQILVWNLYTGKFDTAPILFIDSDPTNEYEVINLYFSDGTTVKVISEHAFWDFDLNEYIFLRNDAAKYIGHWFNKQITDANGNLSYTKVQLTNVIVANEITKAWSPVTFGYLCYYVNGMLSMPGATEGLINIFNVNADTMMYDEKSMQADRNEFGLFTYEEFAKLYPVPETIFNAFGGQYLKVAIGKGFLNETMLKNLIERYDKFFR